MAGFPYHLYGGAQRPDALQFNPAFNDALLRMYTAAPPAVQQELGLTSGYRSPAVQQVLWDKSDKTGHSVAAPGKSKHQAGTAADLYGFGLGDGAHVSQATKDWVNANANAYGLYFPMGHEPWHIQLRGEGAVDQATSLGQTMAQATTGPSETDLAKQQLYSGLASGLGSDSADARTRGTAITGDVTGAPQAMNLEVPRATPVPEAAPSFMPTGIPSLADLFQVKGNIGAAALPTKSTRRA